MLNKFCFNKKNIITVVCVVVIFTLFFSTSFAATKKVVLTTEDGYHITGNLTEAKGKAGVVLLHMFKNNKESWQPLVKQLSARGITSLAIDMRGHGESRTNPKGEDDSNRVHNRDTELFMQMHFDAEAAIRYLIDQKIVSGKIGLVGASVGCSVAVHTISLGQVPNAAVVLMTPGKNYLGLSTISHIKNWPGQPLLILTSDEEQARGARSIYEKLKNNGATIKVFDIEDIHGTNMFGEVDEVEGLISDWLADKLL